MAKNPYINNLPYFGGGDGSNNLGFPTGNSYMMVGLCSAGAIGDSQTQFNVNNNLTLGTNTLSIHDYLGGTVHLVPVALHWTGTCWTGLVTYYVTSDGTIAYSAMPTIGLGDVDVAVTGHLFQDLPNLLHLGVGVNMAWNGSYYQCGISLVEYTRYQAVARSKSGIVFPTSAQYSASYEYDECSNTGIRPAIDYAPTIINPQLQPPLATLLYPDPGANYSNGNAVVNPIGQYIYKQPYIYSNSAFDSYPPLGTGVTYQQLTGLPGYVQAIGVMNETSRNGTFVIDTIDPSYPCFDWYQTGRAGLFSHCYSLDSLPAMQTLTIGTVCPPGWTVGYDWQGGAYTTRLPTPVWCPNIGTILPNDTYGVNYTGQGGWTITATDSIIQSVLNDCAAFGFTPACSINATTDVTLQQFLDATGWPYTIENYDGSNLGPPYTYITTTGLGPYSVYNKIPMQPAGYNLYCFALGHMLAGDIYGNIG